MSDEYSAEQELYPPGHPQYQERTRERNQEGFEQDQEYPVGHPQYRERFREEQPRYEQQPMMGQDDSARSGFGTGGQQSVGADSSYDQPTQPREPIVIGDAPAPQNIAERVVDDVKSFF